MAHTDRRADDTARALPGHSMLCPKLGQQEDIIYLFEKYKPATTSVTFHERRIYHNMQNMKAKNNPGTLWRPVPHSLVLTAGLFSPPEGLWQKDLKQSGQHRDTEWFGGEGLLDL